MILISLHFRMYDYVWATVHDNPPHLSMHPVKTHGGKAAFHTSQQQCSQNAKRITHIKGRLLDQAMILFNYVPFQMGTSHKGKNLLQEGGNSFLYEQFLIVWNITFITLSDLP